MRKRIATLLLAFAFLIPCMFMLSSCSKDKEDVKVKSIAIELSNSNYTLEGDTITVPYGSKVALSASDFKVTATLEDDTTKVITLKTDEESGFTFESTIPNDIVTPRGEYKLTFGHADVSEKTEIKVKVVMGTIDLSKFSWNYPTTGYTYNGREQTVEISNLPNYMTVQYKTKEKDSVDAGEDGNSKKSTGTYITTATFTCTDTENFNPISGDATISIEWKINKARLTIKAKNQTLAIGEEIEEDVDAIGLVGADYGKLSTIVTNINFDYNPTFTKDAQNRVTTAGTFTVMPSGVEESENYIISYQSGTIKVLDYFNSYSLAYQKLSGTDSLTGVVAVSGSGPNEYNNQIITEVKPVKTSTEETTYYSRIKLFKTMSGSSYETMSFSDEVSLTDLNSISGNSLYVVAYDEETSTFNRSDIVGCGELTLVYKFDFKVTEKSDYLGNYELNPNAREYMLNVGEWDSSKSFNMVYETATGITVSSQLKTGSGNYSTAINLTGANTSAIHKLSITAGGKTYISEINLMIVQSVSIDDIKDDSGSDVTLTTTSGSSSSFNVDSDNLTVDVTGSYDASNIKSLEEDLSNISLGGTGSDIEVKDKSIIKSNGVWYIKFTLTSKDSGSESMYSASRTSIKRTSDEEQTGTGKEMYLFLKLIFNGTIDDDTTAEVKLYNMIDMQSDAESVELISGKSITININFQCLTIRLSNEYANACLMTTGDGATLITASQNGYLATTDIERAGTYKLKITSTSGTTVEYTIIAIEEDFASFDIVCEYEEDGETKEQNFYLTEEYQGNLEFENIDTATGGVYVEVVGYLGLLKAGYTAADIPKTLNLKSIYTYYSGALVDLFDESQVPFATNSKLVKNIELKVGTYGSKKLPCVAFTLYATITEESSRPNEEYETYNATFIFVIYLTTKTYPATLTVGDEEFKFQATATGNGGDLTYHFNGEYADYLYARLEKTTEETKNINKISITLKQAYTDYSYVVSTNEALSDLIKGENQTTAAIEAMISAGTAKRATADNLTIELDVVFTNGVCGFYITTEGFVGYCDDESMAGIGMIVIVSSEAELPVLSTPEDGDGNPSGGDGNPSGPILTDGIDWDNEKFSFDLGTGDDKETLTEQGARIFQDRREVYLFASKTKLGDNGTGLFTLSGYSYSGSCAPNGSGFWVEYCYGVSSGDDNEAGSEGHHNEIHYLSQNMIAPIIHNEYFGNVIEINVGYFEIDSETGEIKSQINYYRIYIVFADSKPDTQLEPTDYSVNISAYGQSFTNGTADEDGKTSLVWDESHNRYIAYLSSEVDIGNDNSMTVSSCTVTKTNTNIVLQGLKQKEGGLSTLNFESAVDLQKISFETMNAGKTEYITGDCVSITVFYTETSDANDEGSVVKWKSAFEIVLVYLNSSNSNTVTPVPSGDVSEIVG